VTGLHRLLQGGVDLIAQHGYGLSRNRAVRMLSRCSTGGAAPRFRRSMTEKQPADVLPGASPEAARLEDSWAEPKATALLVLADGTVFEGVGLGATGHAVGEVCFNTAMTGYQEILTDPSYAGQIITFTFPHIGNVGTNEEDIESLSMAATPGARGVILRTAITEPSNWRAKLNLDEWLKRRSIV